MTQEHFTDRRKGILPRPKLGELLLENGVVAIEPLSEALRHQTHTGRRLGEILLERELIGDEDLARHLALQWGFRYVDLSGETIDPEAVRALEESLARRHRVLPVRLEDKILTIAMADAMNFEAVQNISFSTGLRVVPVMSGRRRILEGIERHYGQAASIGGLVRETGLNASEGTPEDWPVSAADMEDDRSSLEEKSRMAPVVRLADMIIAGAARMQASDIHIEPGRSDLRIRYRIDGLLRERHRMTLKMLSPLVSRLKVMSGLDIAERRIPQDGAIRFRCDAEDIDLRISTLPTCHGEKVVIRLLNKTREAAGLDRLGLSEEDDRRIRGLLRRKQGILLMTGPTGSGKTTSLYAMIKELSDVTRSVVTVEDPVEYDIEGINQIQVKPAIGLTFASCLRAILRQDPNIILIGEIRDLETAEIAMRASLTGHFVLSTLHTNDAPSAVTRLIDIGVPRYLVASGIIGVVAQRLVRRICPHCRGAGCPACDQEGCLGRVGLYEVMEITPELADQIGRGCTEKALGDHARQLGMHTLLEDAREKIRRGIVTPEEALRVVDGDPDALLG